MEPNTVTAFTLLFALFSPFLVMGFVWLSTRKRPPIPCGGCGALGMGHDETCTGFALIADDATREALGRLHLSGPVLYTEAGRTVLRVK